MPSVSKKQHNFMEAIAHNKAFAKKVGIPQSVGKEFSEADKGKKFKQGGIMKHSDLGQDKKMVKKAVAMHDKQLHGGKKTNLATLKMGGSTSMDGKMKKMAVGGATGSFNSTGSNPYTPPMQTGAIGGLDQLNQSIGTIQNALGGKVPNVGESTQMYKKGGKVNTNKMAMGNAPVDPRAAAMAAKKAAMARGAKRGMPIAGREVPQMAGMPQGNPMMGRMPPQANMPMPTMKKGGEAKAMVKKEVDFMKKKGAPKSMIKHEMAEAKGMKSGGMSCAPKKMARGGGIETKGKTKGKMIKMAAGGSASKRADGCAVRGKTKA
jgi:hypothetical protein